MPLDKDPFSEGAVAVFTGDAGGITRLAIVTLVHRHGGLVSEFGTALWALNLLKLFALCKVDKKIVFFGNCSTSVPIWTLNLIVLAVVFVSG